MKPDTMNRWESILSALGVETHDGKHGPCPICGGNDRFRWDNLGGRGTYICNQCGSGDGWQLVQKTFGVDFARAVEMVVGVFGSSSVTPQHSIKKPNTALMNKIYKSSNPLDGADLVSRYLLSRGLSPSFRSINALRHCHRCYEPDSKESMDAMVATFSNTSGKASTLQMTYLNRLGEKADIKTPKRSMTPKYPMAGGAVRLFNVGKVLGVAEGIETALCGSEMLNSPVWATLSAALLEKFEPPVEVETLIILSDNDKSFTGQKSAYILANRLYKKVQIEVLVPEETGDWLDMLKT